MRAVSENALIDKSWWRFWNTKEENKKIEYNDGYQWAAGILLRTKNEDLVSGFVECSRCFGDFSDFDRGAVDALISFRELIKQEK